MNRDHSEPFLQSGQQPGETHWAECVEGLRARFYALKYLLDTVPTMPVGLRIRLEALRSQQSELLAELLFDLNQDLDPASPDSSASLQKHIRALTECNDSVDDMLKNLTKQEPALHRLIDSFMSQGN